MWGGGEVEYGAGAGREEECGECGVGGGGGWGWRGRGRGRGRWGCVGRESEGESAECEGEGGDCGGGAEEEGVCPVGGVKKEDIEGLRLLVPRILDGTVSGHGRRP